MSSSAARTEEFVRAFAANQRRIYGLVAALIPHPSDADDVFQDVSASLWQKFDEFQPGTDFAAWGLQFAKYAVLKHYEKRRRQGQVALADDVLELIAADAALAIPQMDRRQEALRGCLQKLPQRSRLLLRARYDSGLKTCREVADRVGRSVEAIYKALGRIHGLLLRCIQKSLAEEEQ